VINSYRGLVGNTEAKRLLGKYRPKWKDNIKIELRK
jgi:hypothetical protein